nr:hypothetical protein CFP56_22025 [Quercus suber]
MLCLGNHESSLVEGLYVELRPHHGMRCFRCALVPCTNVVAVIRYELKVSIVDYPFSFLAESARHAYIFAGTAVNSSHYMLQVLCPSALLRYTSSFAGHCPLTLPRAILMDSFNTAPTFGSPAGNKRLRDDDQESEEPLRKFARPTLNLTADGSELWPQDSVISTPTAQSSQLYHQQHKYDSDEQSSMISEPGSPQDISMSSEDEDMDQTSLSQSPDDLSKPNPSSPWRERVQSRNRVSTPFTTTRRSPMSVRTNKIQQHIRSRHPQEIMSSDGHLEVPSPIDEDEVTTPPSAAAAEAAGSQLSMLSVNDMDIEGSADLPTITLHPARSSTFASESTPEFEPMDGGTEQVLVAKRRQRSGAQSNGSVSPAHRSESAGPRGFSMGFRADCEKCRMRVPGHMSHFTV